MAYEVGTAYLNILPSMDGVQRAIERELRGVDTNRAGREAGEGYSSGLSGAAKKITGVLAAAFAAVKVGDFAKDAINQASDLNESATKLEQVFGDATDQVNTFASAGAKALGQSGLAVKDAAATFGVYGKAAGLAGKANADFSTEMVQLSTDLASFYNADPSQTVEALGAALRGESEPMRQFGVLLDDATLRNKALSLGLISTTKDALTPQQKVLAAHAVIMEQTTVAQGDFARTSGGLANQQRILAAQFEDMKGKLGQAFLPAVTATVTALNEKLFPVLDAAGQQVKGFFDVVRNGDLADTYDGSFIDQVALKFNGLNTQISDTVLPALRGNMQEIWSILTNGDFLGVGSFQEDSPIVGFFLGIRDAALNVGESIGPIFDKLGATIMPVFQEIGDTLGPAVVDTFGKLWDAISPLVPTVVDLVSAFNPFHLLLDAIGPLLPQIVDLLADLVTNIGGVLAKVIQTAAPLVQRLADAFKEFVPILVDALAPILPVIADVLGDLADVIGDALISALDAVTPLLNTIVDVIGDLLPFVGRLVQSLLPPLKRLFESLAPAVKSILDAVVPLVEQIADGLIPVVEALQPIIERVFQFIADTIGNAIQVFQGVIDFITGVFSGDWDKAWQGIKEIFGGLWDQIKNVVGTLWDVLRDFFVNLLPRLGDLITSLRDKLWDIGSRFFGWIWQGIQDLWNNTIWPWFQALPGMAWDGIKAAASQMVTWGGEFLSWLWDGIQGFWTGTAWPWITSLPQTFWDGITSFAGGVLGWLGARGSEFLQWLWDGIQAKAVEVKDWFVNLPGTIWDAAQGAFTAAREWGGQLIKYLIEGISGSDSYISAELARTMIKAAESIAPGLGELINLTGVDIDKNIDDYIASLSGSRGALNAALSVLPGRARGGIIPGADPGRRDNMLVPMRSGESVFVPEFTQAIGGESTVNAWNRAAEQGRLGDYGFARGGVIPSMGALLGGVLVKSLLPNLMKNLADATTSAASAASFASNGQWGPGTSDGTLAANAAAARDFIMGKWGITNIGGVYGGSVPGSDHPIGKALDVMIANYLSAAGIAQGTSVADWFVSNPSAFGTKYVIWRGRINEGGTWAPYHHPSDPSGTDPTLEHFDHVHLSFLTGGGQFTGQQATPAGDDNPSKSGFLGSLVEALVGTIKPKFSAGGSISYSGSAGVEQWRSTVLQALGITGQSPSWADAVLKQMDSESSGNPAAINLWDSNATVRGTPSKGLMQVIDPTFRSYALPGYNSNIYDPLSNIIASIRYVLGTYPEGLARFNRAQAYDSGGWLMPGGQGVNLLNRPEAVLTPPQSDALVTHARALEAGFAGQMPDLVINLDSSDPLQVAVGQMITAAWESAASTVQSEAARW